MTITGKPSITTPRDVDSRALKQAIDNIRERLQAIEGEINGLTLGGLSDTDLLLLRTLVANLQNGLEDLQRRVAALEAALAALEFDESDAQCPFFLPVAESYTVGENKQVPFAETIDIDGDLVLDGHLVEVD